MNAVAPLDVIEVQDFNSESECKGNLYLCIFLIYHNNKVKLQEEYYNTNIHNKWWAWKPQFKWCIFVTFLKQFNSWVITLGSSNLELSKRDQSAEKSTSKIENDATLNGATAEAQNDLEELQISHENVSPLHYLS